MHYASKHCNTRSDTVLLDSSDLVVHCEEMNSIFGMLFNRIMNTSGLLQSK